MPSIAPSLMSNLLLSSCCKNFRAPPKSQNPTVLAMHESMVVEVRKMNDELMTKYEEQKEDWYHKTAVKVYMAAERKEEEEQQKQRAEAVVRRLWKIEPKVKEISMPRSETKARNSHTITETSSEVKVEETEEVKEKRQKAKGKGKALEKIWTNAEGSVPNLIKEPSTMVEELMEENVEVCEEDSESRKEVAKDIVDEIMRDLEGEEL
ncbi:hypothetical protein M422DRAFT_269226 [Sphaerobolus stellatus SS14]|uniref:Uncharacterized protein n=1 Tax=Sphaerobolus stellatus (strain SS14) TaxID=990650 RepID=A0A0C9U579_SPHS4|nr:hypothetical protein M422DRAFT_269226 [Sphaerobolus stellatus SS14]